MALNQTSLDMAVLQGDWLVEGMNAMFTDPGAVV